MCQFYDHAAQSRPYQHRLCHKSPAGTDKSPVQCMLLFVQSAKVRSWNLTYSLILLNLIRALETPIGSSPQREQWHGALKSLVWLVSRFFPRHCYGMNIIFVTLALLCVSQIVIPIAVEIWGISSRNSSLYSNKTKFVSWWIVISIWYCVYKTSPIDPSPGFAVHCFPVSILLLPSGLL